MPNVRLRETEYGELIKLSGQLQLERGRKVSVPSTIYALLKFALVNKDEFNHFIEKKRPFEKGFNERLEAMRKAGHPTSRDFTLQGSPKK